MGERVYVSGCMQLVQKMDDEAVLREACYQAARLKLRHLDRKDVDPLERFHAIVDLAGKIEVRELPRSGDARCFEIVEHD